MFASADEPLALLVELTPKLDQKTFSRRNITKPGMGIADIAEKKRQV